MNYKDIIKSWNSLRTSYEQTRAGFLRLALEKNRQSTPYVQEAKALKQEVMKIQNPKDLLKLDKLKPALLAASGLSEKAIKHMTESDHAEAIENLIERYLEPAGKNFVDELVFRYLLTRGDSLGGKMRNIGGKVGEYQLIRNIVSILKLHGHNFKWLDNDAKKWIEGSSDNPDVELRARGLAWEEEGRQRVIMFNINSPIVKKNVDICLFDATSSDFQAFSESNNILKNPTKYIAIGELKGGVDPAGADEHWKTARSALIDRVQKKFKDLQLNPKIFFIGGAIEKSMAEEIYNLLENNHLDFAANLTSEEQMYAICSWLIEL